MYSAAQSLKEAIKASQALRCEKCQKRVRPFKGKLRCNGCGRVTEIASEVK